jgi:hypothetical protein
MGTLEKREFAELVELVESIRVNQYNCDIMHMRAF